MIKSRISSKDHLSANQRSLNMAKIKQKDTKPEVLVRSFLHKNGFRFRKNVRHLPGKPDIYLPKYKTVVLVNGCYWHRHDCKRGKSIPIKNKEFWIDKFSKNIERDIKNKSKLKKLGLKVIEIWTCKLNTKDFKDSMDYLINEIIR